MIAELTEQAKRALVHYGHTWMRKDREATEGSIDALAAVVGTESHSRDEQWIRACREIIDRCVAPDMLGNALAMLERAAVEARKMP